MFQYDPSLGFGFEKPKPVPTGNYLLLIDDTKLLPTENARKLGTGEKRAVFTLKIADGEHKGRNVILSLNLINNNELAQTIAKQEFNSLCAVTQLYQFSPQTDDNNALFEFRGKYLRADVEYVNDGKYEKNEIRAVYDINGLKPGETGVKSSAASPVVSAAPPAAFNPPPMPTVATATALQPVQQPFTPPAAPAGFPPQAPAVNTNPFPPAMPTGAGFPPQS